MKQNHGFWGSSFLWRETNKSIDADPVLNEKLPKELTYLFAKLYALTINICRGGAEWKEADGTEEWWML